MQGGIQAIIATTTAMMIPRDEGFDPNVVVELLYRIKE